MLFCPSRPPSLPLIISTGPCLCYPDINSTSYLLWANPYRSFSVVGRCLHTQSTSTAIRLPIMRRGVLIFIIVNVLIIAFLVHSVFTLLTLLVEDGAADAIHRSDIPAPNSTLIDNREQLIPKIIHQTYIDENIPLAWQSAQKSCQDLHRDYEYKVR